MKKNAGSVLVVVIAVALVLGSCLKKDDGNSEKTEKQSIQDFLEKNPSITFTQTASGLYYYEAKPGAGDVIRPQDSAKVIYTGKFLNGTVFDSNVGGDTLTFLAGGDNMIPGFIEGVSMMKEMGEALLIVPSSLAYGPNGYMFIPGYTPLLFEVRLAKIVSGSGK